MEFAASQYSRVLQVSFSSWKYKQWMSLGLVMGQEVRNQEMAVGKEEGYIGEQVAVPP